MEITRYERHGVLFDSCAAMEEAGFPNGFSTRVGGVSPPPWDSLNLGASCGDQPERVAENFRRFCGAVGTDADALVKNHQVHSDLVRPVTRADIQSDPAAPGVYEADGLVTDEPGVCLTIFSGDCIPVLLYDPVRRCIAAAHAGWRGTALGIAAKAVERMVDCYGCDRLDILAAVGPGISKCCFETHEDVPNAMTEAMGAAALSSIEVLPTGKFHVDLKGLNAKLLHNAGLDPEHIAVSADCTCCLPEKYWSHRYTHGERGSQAAMIAIV